MAETRVALVTGANRGIGLEIARGLARKGYLTVIGARDLAKGKAAAEELKSEGLEMAVVELDVVEAQSVKRAVAECAGLLERIDVLVNNAGIYLDKPSQIGKTGLDVPLDLVLRSFETNALGALRMMQEVVPLMRSAGYGRIVNISSIMGQLAEMGASSVGYRSSKAALNAMTRVIASELAETNIKVNAMHPGWVNTDMGGAMAPRTTEEAATCALWLADLPNDGPTGGFFQDCKPIAW